MQDEQTIVSGPLVGPALGMRYRHHVRGYAIEQLTLLKEMSREYLRWSDVLHMSNGDLAQVIGDADSRENAVERAGAWFAGFLPPEPQRAP